MATSNEQVAVAMIAYDESMQDKDTTTANRMHAMRAALEAAASAPVQELAVRGIPVANVASWPATGRPGRPLGVSCPPPKPSRFLYADGAITTLDEPQVQYELGTTEAALLRAHPGALLLPWAKPVKNEAEILAARVEFARAHENWCLTRRREVGINNPSVRWTDGVPDAVYGWLPT